eukprot:8584331-Pyramimonas_sp.AAC.1
MPSDSVPNAHRLRGRVAPLMATSQNLELELRRLEKATERMECIELGSVPRRTRIIKLQGAGDDVRT